MDYQKIKNSLDLKELNPTSLFQHENFEAIKYGPVNIFMNWSGTRPLRFLIHLKIN